MKIASNKLNIYLKLLIVLLFFLLVMLVRIPFMNKNIAFNNDAEIYSRNIDKPFFSGKYDVQMPGYVSYRAPLKTYHKNLLFSNKMLSSVK